MTLRRDSTLVHFQRQRARSSLIRFFPDGQSSKEFLSFLCDVPTSTVPAPNFPARLLENISHLFVFFFFYNLKMTMHALLALCSLACLLTVVRYAQSVPVPISGSTVHGRQRTTFAGRYRNSGIRRLLATGHNFSAIAKGLQLMLRGKRLNKGNLKLVTADLVS